MSSLSCLFLSCLYLLPRKFLFQNKVELVKAEAAKAQYEEIKEFVRGTIAEGVPIVPISAVGSFPILSTRRREKFSILWSGR